MGNLPMSVEEFREEFSKLFNQKSEEFFQKVYGLGKGGKKGVDADFMSVSEVADFFKVSRVTISSWVATDKIISIKKGNRRLFSRDYMERYKQANFIHNERISYNPVKYV
jgi:excisionase family DNA binding protein